MRRNPQDFLIKEINLSIHNLRSAADQLTAAERDELICMYRDNSESGRIARAAEAANNSIQTRVEDIIRLAEAMGSKKLGIAHCVGLLGESRTLAKILRKRGFDVFGVCCKVAGTKKACVGITEEQLAGFKPGPIMCNPIMQAKLLSSENTDLNIVMGLCAGSDALFVSNAAAMTTIMINKDRLTCNNPAVTLYSPERRKLL